MHKDTDTKEQEQVLSNLSRKNVKHSLIAAFLTREFTETEYLWLLG